MSIVRNCSTCAYWRSGAHSSMLVPALDESYEDVGACENVPPQIITVDGGPETVQPTTHASRCCAEWSRGWVDYDDPDDDDDDPDGEPKPASDPDPDIAKVRRLFPNPPRPIAA